MYLRRTYKLNPHNRQINVKDGRPCCRLFRLATQEGLVTNCDLVTKPAWFWQLTCFQVMQTVLDFGPVLFSRSSKYCLWISSRFLSSSNSYSNGSGAGQTPREIAKWMGEHAPVFAVNGKNISVLHEPNQFFSTLKVRCLHCAIFRLLRNDIYCMWAH